MVIRGREWSYGLLFRFIINWKSNGRETAQLERCRAFLLASKSPREGQRGLGCGEHPLLHHTPQYFALLHHRPQYFTHLRRTYSVWLSVNEYFYKDMTSDESPVIQLICGERKAPAELGIKTTTIFLFCISKGIWEKKGKEPWRFYAVEFSALGNFCLKQEVYVSRNSMLASYIRDAVPKTALLQLLLLTNSTQTHLLLLHFHWTLDPFIIIKKYYAFISHN